MWKEAVVELFEVANPAFVWRNREKPGKISVQIISLRTEILKREASHTNANL
jgi:hypothetical protein